jgi:hypothetical protein
MDPGEGWVLEEVGHHLQRNDLLCRSGMAQGTQSSGTRQGQCCKRNPGRMDIWEEMLAATEMQRCHKELRPKGMIMSGKQGKC